MLENHEQAFGMYKGFWREIEVFLLKIFREVREPFQRKRLPHEYFQSVSRNLI